MAISIKKYVDITTQFPSVGASGRALGGLAFTATDPLSSNNNPEAALYKQYQGYMQGDVIVLDVGEADTFFGQDSVEARFANGYYSYLSPSGRFASKLQFRKILSTETKKEAFINTNKITNMFGSFTFLSSGTGGDSSAAEASEMAELQEVAAENGKLDTKYLFVINDKVDQQTPDEIAQKVTDYFKNIRGVCFVAGAFDWSAYMPMALLASTDYDGGSVINFMFKSFATEDMVGEESGIAVADDSAYQTFNKNCVNFYGQTQTNGQTLNFFQRGFNTDGMDTGIYCNEMWFKGVCETALLDLLHRRERLSADPFGVDTVKLELEDCCGPAVNNGMFMVKDISRKDFANISELVIREGGDLTTVNGIAADISSKGYSIFAVLSKDEGEQLGQNPEYIIKYYVFYGAADSIRFIKGTNILL